jgi:hypothetical protein
MSESIQSRCEYHVLENGIHEFVMLEFSRAGVDAFIDAIDRMNMMIAPGIPRPVLVDSSGGIQPLNYLFSRLRRAVIRKPGEQSSRLALILPSSRMAGMIGGMMRIFPNLNLRIFLPEDRETAARWLLEG